MIDNTLKSGLVNPLLNLTYTSYLRWMAALTRLALQILKQFQLLERLLQHPFVWNGISNCIVHPSCSPPATFENLMSKAFWHFGRLCGAFRWCLLRYLFFPHGSPWALFNCLNKAFLTVTGKSVAYSNNFGYGYSPVRTVDRSVRTLVHQRVLPSSKKIVAPPFSKEKQFPGHARKKDTRERELT